VIFRLVDDIHLLKPVGLSQAAGVVGFSLIRAGAFTVNMY
jgi:hypothetical protein